MGKTTCLKCCWTIVFVLFTFIVLFIILGSPWLVSTIVTRINTCCRFEFELTGSLFGDYTFGSDTISSTCDYPSCANFTINEFLSKMDYKIKQDASSAESTLAFVRAFPLLLLCQTIVCIILCCCHQIKYAIQVFFELLMIAMTILSTAGVSVYSTVYIDKIGFTYGDLGSGWKWAVALCSLTLIGHMILVYLIVSDVLEKIQDRKKRRKAKKERNFILTISQQTFNLGCRSPTRQIQTNTSLGQQPQNKITAADWLFVKLDDRDTIADIHEIVRYEHALTCTDDMDNAVTDLPKTIQLKINTLEGTQKEIVIFFQKLLDTIWDQDLVGKGADAKNLSHNTLNVISVDPGYIDYNINVRKYMSYRSVILKRIKRFGELPCLNDAHCSPIQTTEFIENVPKVYLRLMGMKNLNTRLNEYFLFHGTSECNVDNILQYGFDISKVKRPFLGKGIYFTENPVKADQYTGDYSSSTGCILLCRVILGNFITRKTHPKSNMTSWNHLPCSRCLDEECGQHSPDERFDSLIYDQPHGLFREFVIFNTDQILVESVIKYTRVTDSENHLDL